MSEPELPPLGDDLRALLDAERGRPPVHPSTRSRLSTRLEASLAAGAGVAVSGLLATKGKGWIVALSAFALGGVLGAGITYFTRGTPEPRVVYVERRVEVAPSAATVASTAASVPDVTTAPPASATAAPSIASHPAPSAAPSASAEEERNLIDAARAALKRGDPAGALGYVDSHAKRFPNGKLGEEREAYAVQALARAGRGAEAKARADRFKKRWPASLYLSMIDEAAP